MSTFRKKLKEQSENKKQSENSQTQTDRDWETRT